MEEYKKCHVCMDIKVEFDFSHNIHGKDFLSDVCTNCIKKEAFNYLSTFERTHGFKRMRKNLNKRTNTHILKKEIKGNIFSIDEFLGCSLPFFKNYIEAHFTKGMNWDNYGEWHLDHIKPIRIADDILSLLELTHYTNFQPLWARDNSAKGGRF